MSITAVTVPKWGIEMQEATLAEWKVTAGDVVAKGDEIVDLETDKIVNSHEAPVAGVIARIIGEADERYDVGALIAVIAVGGTPDADIEQFIANFVPVDASFENEDAAAEEPKAVVAPSASPAGGISISPIAKRLAESLSLDWTTIVGTGRNGRISKQDVEATAAAAQAAPIKQSAMARTAAERMQAAKQDVPHFYLQIDIRCDAAQQQRASYNADNNCRVTLNDVLVKAVAHALAEHPAVDVTYQDGVLFAAEPATGVAIATEEGLIAPVLPDPRRLSLVAVSEGIKHLASLASARRLSVEQLSGGATTVSNLGMFGIDGFTAIINPPQTSIIAVGKAQPQIVVEGDGPAVASVMKLTMSCDHRAFDGATGAKFLATLKKLLETPDSLFV